MWIDYILTKITNIYEAIHKKLFFFQLNLIFKLVLKFVEFSSF